MRLPPEMMKLARHIIRFKSGDFDQTMLEDHYRRALVRILRKKQAKRSPRPPAVKPSRENVINLMDALRRSVAAQPPPSSNTRHIPPPEEMQAQPQPSEIESQAERAERKMVQAEERTRRKRHAERRPGAKRREPNNESNNIYFGSSQE